jgi:hypothetical protein
LEIIDRASKTPKPQLFCLEVKRNREHGHGRSPRSAGRPEKKSTLTQPVITGRNLIIRCTKNQRTSQHLYRRIPCSEEHTAPIGREEVIEMEDLFVLLVVLIVTFVLIYPWEKPK